LTESAVSSFHSLSLRAALPISVAGLAVRAGCAARGPEIHSDYDDTADFSSYATYAFMERAERGETRNYDTLDDRRVIAAVTRELESRGYREDTGNPDLLVNFAMATEEIQDVPRVPAAIVPPPCYG